MHIFYRDIHMYYKQCIYTYGDVVDVISQIRTHEYRLKYDESKYNNKTEVKNASQMKKNGQCKQGKYCNRIVDAAHHFVPSHTVGL